MEKESLREEKGAGLVSSVSAKRCDGEAKEEKAKRFVFSLHYVALFLGTDWFYESAISQAHI